MSVISTESPTGALQRAYDGVTELIAAGTFEPGSRLREGTLAEALGVSRTPIREALRRLAAEGMVEMLPNRGALLIGFSSEDLESLSALRLRMEPYGVRLAVPRLTEILEAAKEGDAEWAEAVMRVHILAGRSTVLGFADQ